MREEPCSRNRTTSACRKEYSSDFNNLIWYHTQIIRCTSFRIRHVSNSLKNGLCRSFIDTNIVRWKTETRGKHLLKISLLLLFWAEVRLFLHCKSVQLQRLLHLLPWVTREKPSVFQTSTLQQSMWCQRTIPPTWTPTTPCRSPTQRSPRPRRPSPSRRPQRSPTGIRTKTPAADITTPIRQGGRRRRLLCSSLLSPHVKFWTLIDRSFVARD